MDEHAFAAAHFAVLDLLIQIGDVRISRISAVLKLISCMRFMIDSDVVGTPGRSAGVM
jgi:hypothetical protein